MRVSHHAHRHLPGPTGAGLGREVGATLVEFAMVAMFLLTIVSGSLDLGLAWRVTLVNNEAVRAGARSGSSLDQAALADWYALSSARAALSSGGQLANVQRVVIYKSTATNGDVPAACITATSTTEDCNILTGAQFRALAQADFNTTSGCIVSGKATVANWCPNERDNVQLTANYYGLWIRVRYTNEFKVLGDGLNIDRNAVMRLEPDVN